MMKSLSSQEVKRNLEVLGNSRRRPKPGDIFCVKIVDGTYYFGRVIKCNCVIGPYDRANLLYFYGAPSAAAEEIPLLTVNDLLIPPVITNNKGWLDGYFWYLKNVDLTADDILPTHCFWDAMFNKHRNEYWEELETRSEPCGEAGLSSYSYIDYQIGRALGLKTIDG